MHSISPASFGTGARPYYLFHLGTGVDGGPTPPVACNGSNSSSARSSSVDTGNLAHRAPNPDGPWEPIPSMTPTCNNPAPVWHPNGTLYLACNNGQGRVPWPIYASPDGGFTWRTVAEITLPSAWNNGGNARSAPYVHLRRARCYSDRLCIAMTSTRTRARALIPSHALPLGTGTWVSRTRFSTLTPVGIGTCLYTATASAMALVWLQTPI